jgi:hypothetical protein
VWYGLTLFGQKTGERGGGGVLSNTGTKLRVPKDGENS